MISISLNLALGILFALMVACGLLAYHSWKKVRDKYQVDELMNVPPVEDEQTSDEQE